MDFFKEETGPPRGGVFLSGFVGFFLFLYSVWIFGEGNLLN